MFQQYFQHKGLVTLPILTMLLFAAVFVAVLVRALRSPDEQAARLPLLDGEGQGTQARDAGGDHV